MIGGESDVYTHAATQTEQQNKTESCVYSDSLYFNNLLFVSRLDKNSCNVKTQRLYKKHTNRRYEQSNNGGGSNSSTSQMEVYNSAREHARTLRHNLNHRWSHTLNPHKLRTDLCTYCTLAISLKEPSLIILQSIIHTHLYSLCPFPWQAHTGC